MSRAGSRLLALVAAAVVGVSALSGCSLLGGSDDKPASANGQVEKSKVKVAVIPKLIDIAGLQRSIKSGYFKDQGLEVELVNIKTGADALTMFKNNELDFAFGNWTSFIEAQAKKVVELKMVADGLQAKEGMTALVAMPGSSIKTPKDISGKTIGVNALRSNVELTTRAVLGANDVDLSTVNMKVISTDQALTALQTKQVEVMSLQEPNLTTAKQKLGVVVVADRATGPVADFPISGYVSSAKFAGANPKTVAAFQRAMAKGQADVADRQTLEKTLKEYAELDEATSRLVVAGVFPTSVDKTRLQRVADLMHTFKILTDPFDISPMIQPAPAA